MENNIHKLFFLRPGGPDSQNSTALSLIAKKGKIRTRSLIFLALRKEEENSFPQIQPFQVSTQARS